MPVTIETGTSDTNVNFYNAENRFEYGVSYDMDGLKLASEIGDCRLVEKGEGDEYKVGGVVKHIGGSKKCWFFFLTISLLSSYV